MPSERSTALITGSSRGIGQGITKRLADAGFNIILHCRSLSDDLLKTESQLKQAGAEVHCLAFDIADIERHSDERVAEAVRCMRIGAVSITPGFDGEYGHVELFEDAD